MQSQPLWIVGAPRCGTTFLTAVLNAHPQITLTAEARLFVLLKQIIEVDCERPDLLDGDYRDGFKDFLKRRAGALIESYYRDTLGVDTVIWGDKHPPYADPALLSGRDDSRMREPHSGSALRLIDEVLPQSKYIHIHRSPEQVARSLVSRGWTPSVADGIAVHRQYVAEVGAFFSRIDGRRCLTLPYADLLERPDDAAASVAQFLDIDAAPIAAFLDAQRRNPTPYSQPVRNLTDVYRAL